MAKKETLHIPMSLSSKYKQALTLVVHLYQLPLTQPFIMATCYITKDHMVSLTTDSS